LQTALYLRGCTVHLVQLQARWCKQRESRTVPSKYALILLKAILLRDNERNDNDAKQRRGEHETLAKLFFILL
uniref:Secreted protein n=1 Tax=Ascaris lumbricoides TaxID=6252 RepID=A0A0M3I0B3_ASCLU